MEATTGLWAFLQIGALSQCVIDRNNGKVYISRLLQCYAIGTFVVYLGILLYVIFSGNELLRGSDSNIGDTVDYIQILGIGVTHLVTISEVFLHRRCEGLFISQVSEIDRIFERSLNVNMDNRALRNQIIRRAIIMFAVYLISELLILVAKFLSKDRQIFTYWLCYMLPFFICGLRYFQISLAIIIVRQRLDKLGLTLNELNLLQDHHKLKDAKSSSNTPIEFISNALPTYETSDYMNRRYDMENPDMKRLLIIRDLYNRLWEVADILNRHCGVSILASLGNDFISITANSYWVFLNFRNYSATLDESLEISSSSILSMQHIFNVFMLALLCDGTVQKTNAIALGLHRIELNIWNDNHNTVIEQFSLQLLHQKLSFSAAGFFDINCTLLYTIAGATTTYLIILIQFHMS